MSMRKIKAFAVIRKDCGAIEYVRLIEKNAHLMVAEAEWECEIVPCTISYSLPKPRGKVAR